MQHTVTRLCLVYHDTASQPREDLLSYEAVDSLLGEALTHLHELDGALILDPFEDFMNTVAEAGCPSILSTTNYTDINGDCVTSDGVTLFMDIRWIRDGASTGDGGAEIIENAVLSGEAVALDESGKIWSSSTVNSHRETISPDGVRIYTSQIVGSVDVPGVEGWPGQNLSLALIQEWYTEADGVTPMALALRGGASQLEGESLAAYSFVDLALWTEEGGGPCSIEPAGSVELHTLGGSRYLVVFDGVDPTTETTITEAEECDGEAEIFFEGESLGRFEPDLTALMDWQERPW